MLNRKASDVTKGAIYKAIRWPLCSNHVPYGTNTWKTILNANTDRHNRCVKRKNSGPLKYEPQAIRFTTSGNGAQCVWFHH